MQCSCRFRFCCNISKSLFLPLLLATEHNYVSCSLQEFVIDDPVAAVSAVLVHVRNATFDFSMASALLEKIMVVSLHDSTPTKANFSTAKVY